MVSVRRLVPSVSPVRAKIRTGEPRRCTYDDMQAVIGHRPDYTYGQFHQKSRKALEMLDYSPALMTDMYEYTMLDACLKDGTANRKCVFEIFTRHLPLGRHYGVVAGQGRILMW